MCADMCSMVFRVCALWLQACARLAACSCVRPACKAFSFAFHACASADRHLQLCGFECSLFGYRLHLLGLVREAAPVLGVRMRHTARLEQSTCLNRIMRRHGVTKTSACSIRCLMVYGFIVMVPFWVPVGRSVLAVLPGLSHQTGCQAGCVVKNLKASCLLPKAGMHTCTYLDDPPCAGAQ